MFSTVVFNNMFRLTVKTGKFSILTELVLFCITHVLIIVGMFLNYFKLKPEKRQSILRLKHCHLSVI